MRPARPLLLCALLFVAACSNESAAPTADAPAPAPASAPTPAAAADAPVTPPAEPIADGRAQPEPAVAAPDVMDGLVRADDTVESMRARFREDDFLVGQIPGAEGEMVAGWTLYPLELERTLTVYLDEAGVHPVLVVARGDDSFWRRDDAVRLGLDIVELTELNGGPFDFFGFEWDYGGAIVDWRGGQLAPDGESLGPVRLCAPDFGDAWPKGYPSGDGEFASDLAVVAAHPPTVCEIGVVIAPALEE